MVDRQPLPNLAYSYEYKTEEGWLFLLYSVCHLFYRAILSTKTMDSNLKRPTENVEDFSTEHSERVVLTDEDVRILVL